MRNEADIGMKMTAKARQELSTLCEKHPHMFSHLRSPPPDELTEFHRLLTKTSYAQGLASNGHLKKALDMLEREFHRDATFVPPAEFDAEELKKLKAAKRLEREVRLIHRLAALSKPNGATATLFLSGPQNRKRQNAIAALKMAATKVADLTNDEFLRRVLPPKYSTPSLRLLAHELSEAAATLNAAQPEYPNDRVREEDNAYARQLVNQMSNSCFRIYANCSANVIKTLALCPGLELANACDDFREIMKEALSRKIKNFQLRMSRPVPKYDYTHTGLDGEWMSVGENDIGLQPAINLDPPWMAA